MSLHPIKSRRRNRKAYSQLRAREEWKPWKGWNWSDTKKKGLGLFGSKRFVKGFFVLIVIIGGLVFANLVLKSYETSPTVGASQTIWDSSNFPNSAAEFTFSHAVYSASCVGTTGCIKLQATSTNPGIALDKQSISLDTISGHEVSFRNDWCFPNGPNNVNNRWGFYLTRNSTLPTEAGYAPRNDPSVALILEKQDSGSGNIKAYNWIQRAATATIQSGDTSGGNQGIGSLFLGLITTQDTGTCNSGGNHNTIIDELMNFTGSGTAANPSVSTLYESTPGTASNNQPQLSWLAFQSVPYYVGFFQEECSCNNVDILGNEFIARYDPATAGAYTLTPQTPDAGFFGPLVRALIPIGVFILNGVLQFVAFLGPTLQSALTFLESIIAVNLNILGSLIGYPTAGTDLFTAINALLNFFGQAPSIFSNVPALFSRFVDANSAYFTWLPTALSIASTIASLAINSVSFVLTIIQFAFKLVAGVYLIILLTLFLVYTGDDSLGGILGFLETTQWLILGPLGWLARILNFILDIITSIIGLIPKPFVQMVAHAFPRIPIVETSARFVNPSFDLAAIRSGNMLAVWAWFVDFTFLAWYNGITPALPGSLGNLLPGMPATTFAALRGFLPILEIFLIIISALAFIIWPVNKMLSVFALDLDVLDFDMSPGRKLSSGGLGGLRLSKAKKRFQKLKPGVEFKEREKLKSRTQVELEDLQRQKAGAKTIEEVKAARARDEAIRQRELEAKARASKDIKRVKLGPLGPEDE